MKINKFILIFSAFLFPGMLFSEEIDSLRKGFTDPPACAKPGTWWHWVNGNVTKQGITEDLESMKGIGVQEAQIFNVGVGYPDGQADYMSDNWLNLLYFAAQEAERLDLKLGFHNCAGWSSSGGPWVKPENAMRKVVCEKMTYRCSRRGEKKIPLPDINDPYYEDIATLAFPEPLKEQYIPGLSYKNLSGEIRNHLFPDTTVISDSAIVHLKDVVDLTSKIRQDNTIEWDVPIGDWVILRVGHTITGTKNRPAPMSGQGYECDKMSKEAVDAFWKSGVQPIIEKLGSLIGSTVVSCLIDSYEVGCANWTNGFDAEFKKLRGYDIKPFLPTFAGYYIESGIITEKFLWDLRKTIGELISKNYYSHFRDLCHANGLRLSIEPYWGPFDCMEVGKQCDIPMAEFWSTETNSFDSPKFVSSLAHISGKTIVEAESFTGEGGWSDHPATLKPIGDMAWTEGITRFIFHTYAHQPWNIGPGVTMGSNGLDFNRLNTWWKQGKSFLSYISRSQFLLQQGNNVADILIFTGESSPNNAFYFPEIKKLGYDYDLIGASDLMALEAKDGIIYSPSCGAYKVLFLQNTQFLTPELLIKIQNLAKNGAKIIGERPIMSPSLQGYPECDETVRLLADQLWGRRIVVEGTLTDLLSELGCERDFYTEDANNQSVKFIHRNCKDVDIYFLSSPVKENHTENCHFRVTGKQPEIWDPMTGRMSEVAYWNENTNGTISIPITFHENGSLFVIFRESSFKNRHIIKAEIRDEGASETLLPNLKIINAEYGTFLPVGLAEVTDNILEKIDDGGNLYIACGNHLCSSDPAPGYIKELRMEFEQDGKMREVRLFEGESTQIVVKNIKSFRAVYGKFDASIQGLPERQSVVDVKHILEEKIASGVTSILVNDDLLGAKKLNMSNKELHFSYSADGSLFNKVVNFGNSLSLAKQNPKSEIINTKGKVSWVSPHAGKIQYVSSNGLENSESIDNVPEPIEINGPWRITFNPSGGQPFDAEFDSLQTWELSSEERIRHFSGTAVYHSDFLLPKYYLKDEYDLRLDLSEVFVIAEVIVNGHEVGALWTYPYEINIKRFLHAGKNTLDIKVTNLWVNRLIGDEAKQPDFDIQNGIIHEWPDWLIYGSERTSGRTTFYTCKHWNKDSPLQRSGLKGPVIIRAYVNKILRL